MKSVFILLFTFSMLATFGQDKAGSINVPDPNKKIEIVEMACGECKLGLSGDDCDLAVRINGKSYFVDGTKIDAHGDAHAKDGFCNAIRKAEVQGEVKEGRFKLTYIRLITPLIPE